MAFPVGILWVVVALTVIAVLIIAMIATAAVGRRAVPRDVASAYLVFFSSVAFLRENRSSIDQ
jgi:hypothetical protein